MNTQKIEQGQKVGKRLAQSEVGKLMQAIGLLLDVAGYVDYKDDIEELFAGLTDTDKAITRGDLEKIQERMESRKPANTASATSGGGGANWSAGVGQAIVGNLARGKGGRFVSLSNINKMTGMLDRANISPDMFEGIQALLAGNEVDTETLGFLQAAGLVSDDGVVSAKANDIVKAISSGDPDNLKNVVTPKKSKSPKGRGKKPDKPPKPTKDEIQAKNISDLKENVVSNERLTNEQYEALIGFANGKDVDKIVMDDLEELGLAEIDKSGFYRLTKNGNSVMNALQKGNLRGALDTLSKAKDDAIKKQEEIAKNIEKAVKSLADAGISEDLINDILGLTQNIGPQDKETLENIGIIESQDGETEITDVGNAVMYEIENDAVSEEGQLIMLGGGVVGRLVDGKITIVEEKSFGFKVLEGKQNDYFLTWTTNAFEDREKEIFTLKSIQEYVENNVDNDDKGVYQFWHENGSDFADIVWQGIAGKFLVEIGKFRKDFIGQAFKAFFLKYPNGHPEIAKNGWGCSHGFVYRKADREDGIYEWFDKKETTILPLEEAANVYTLMEVL